jgi:hypothetical protein
LSDVETPPGADARQALAAEVARLWRRVGELDGAVKSVSAAVVGSAALAHEIEELQSTQGELAGMVARLAEAKEEATRPQRPIWWPDVTDADEHRAAWQALGAWVDEALRGRHPELYKSLRQCWYRHPDVVDELCALWLAWWGAYKDPRASASAPIEWHDRWLPGCIARCAKAVAGCKGSHESVAERAGLDDDGEFSRFVEDETAR